MEFTLEKILELKEAARELTKAARDAEIAYKRTPSTQIRLRAMVTECPVDRIQGEQIQNGYVAAQRDYASENWLAVSKLAKSIHAPLLFRQRGTRPYYGGQSLYFERQRVPVKLCDLSEDQLELSASLASELAAVYNKYFSLANQTAKVMYCGDSEFTELPVKIVG